MPIADSSSIFSTTNHPHSNTASTSLQHPCHWRAAYPFLSVDLSYLNSDYTLHMLKSCSFSINSKESSMLYWNLIPKLHGKNHNDEISLHFKKAISGRHHTSGDVAQRNRNHKVRSNYKLYFFTKLNIAYKNLANNKQLFHVISKCDSEITWRKYRNY